MAVESVVEGDESVRATGRPQDFKPAATPTNAFNRLSGFHIR